MSKKNILNANDPKQNCPPKRNGFSISFTSPQNNLNVFLLNRHNGKDPHDNELVYDVTTNSDGFATVLCLFVELTIFFKTVLVCVFYTEQSTIVRAMSTF
ncbi:unnamed protein product [Clavelina lepadiformis]|uniref:Uncharacterized protein n=1 Tax=Clavelina lepadiformis TaxID=159417 RepID=A0ABP0EUN6_CLALP